MKSAQTTQDSHSLYSERLDMLASCDEGQEMRELRSSSVSLGLQQLRQRCNYRNAAVSSKLNRTWKDRDRTAGASRT